MKKPWITGGDNFALFLPILTLIALVFAFIGGKVFEFMMPKKEIIIKNNTSRVFERFQTSCEPDSGLIVKAHSELTFVAKICEDKLTIESNSAYLGECKIPPFDYTRIEITINQVPFPVESCLFIK